MSHLKGMQEITRYIRRSEATVIDWIRSLNFPAKKISQGIWESDTNLIDKWRIDQLENDDEIIEEKPINKGTKYRKKR